MIWMNYGNSGFATALSFIGSLIAMMGIYYGIEEKEPVGALGMIAVGVAVAFLGKLISDSKAKKASSAQGQIPDQTTVSAQASTPNPAPAPTPAASSNAAAAPAASPTPIAQQAPQEARFCPHCGAPAKPQARFCASCGRSL